MLVNLFQSNAVQVVFLQIWMLLQILFAITLLTIPNVWNRLIVLVGRFLRRY